MRGSAGRGGVALPVLLLLVLALTAVSHGALLLARDALRSARTWAAAGQARIAAEVGVVVALEAWGAWRDPRPALWEGATVAEGGLGPRGRYRVRLRTLGSELRLLEGEGRVEPGGARRRVGRVAWILDPATRLGAATAVAEVGGRVRVDAGSEVSGLGIGDPPEGWDPGACHRYRTVLDSLFPAGVLPAAASLPPEDRPEPGLGLLPMDTLVAMADLRVEGRVSPSPESVDGACVPGGSNWGEPGDPSAPCGARLVIAAATGPLVMDGGEGQGVLVVDGDLRLTGGARFAGVVLAAGGLRVEAASRIDGVARVGGELDVRDGGVVLGRGCPVLRALEAAGALRRPVLPPGGSWLSPL